MEVTRGVYFKREDYAGFWLRLLIDGIDFVVAGALCLALVGYRVGAVRIVGLDCQTVSWSTLTFRLVFFALGPLNWLLDLIWLAGDPHRQTLRDKFAHTYIIKRRAEPVGTGKVVYRRYEVLGYNFIFREIEERVQSGPPATPVIAA